MWLRECRSACIPEAYFASNFSHEECHSWVWPSNVADVALPGAGAAAGAPEAEAVG